MSIRSRMFEIIENITPPVILRIYEKMMYNRRIQAATQKLPNHSKLHLACGTNVLQGWGNIDLIGGKNIIYWNCTTRFPLKDNTVDFIFTEHFIEHITQSQGIDLLRECYRVLAPGGVIRISTPNLKKIVDEYLVGESSQWRDLKYSKNSGAEYTPCRMVNDSMRLWGHQFIYDTNELQKALLQAGFTTINPMKKHESTYPELRNLECRPYYGDIILEAVK